MHHTSMKHGRDQVRKMVAKNIRLIAVDSMTKAASLEQSCSAVVNLRVFLDTDDSANTLLTGTTIFFFFSVDFPEVLGRSVPSSVTSQPVASCVPVLSSPVVLVISDGESQFERVNSQSTFFSVRSERKVPRDHNNSFVPVRNAGFQSLQEMSE